MLAYHRDAEPIGLDGIMVDDPERVGAAWDAALAADRPTIVNCCTDANVLPPHVRFAEAMHFLSMMRTEPELGSVLEQTIEQTIRGVASAASPEWRSALPNSRSRLSCGGEPPASRIRLSADATRPLAARPVGTRQAPTTGLVETSLHRPQ